MRSLILPYKPIETATWATCVGFNLYWFVCVAHSDWALLSFLLMLGGALAMFALLANQTKRVLIREFLWLLGLSLFGFIFETGLFQLQLLVAEAPGEFIPTAPLWLVLVWAGFALSFRYGLVKLIGLGPWLAVIGLLALGSYWGGAALNTQVAFGEPYVLAAVVIALSWALLLPLLINIYQRVVYVA